MLLTHSKFIIEAKVRGLVLTGVLPRLADGRRKGMICSVSFLECAVQDAFAIAAQLRTTVHSTGDAYEALKLNPSVPSHRYCMFKMAF